MARVCTPPPALTARLTAAMETASGKSTMSTVSASPKAKYMASTLPPRLVTTWSTAARRPLPPSWRTPFEPSDV
jgi:hypothetical protein